jgi:hypothetical protein
LDDGARVAQHATQQFERRIVVPAELELPEAGELEDCTVMQ